MWDKGDVDYLIDLWLVSVPDIDPAQRIILEKLPYEGYDPRTDTITKRWVHGNPLFDWIKGISNRRGFPFQDKQVADMLNGKANYGG